MFMNIEDLQHREDFGEFLEAWGVEGTGVELGVFRGEFSRSILSGWSGKLIGVDRYNGGAEFDIFLAAIERNREDALSGRYTIFVSTTDMAARLIPPGLAFVYVDADHSYEAVKKDINNWWPRIRHGGILCGHDYGKPETGVGLAVSEFMKINSGLKLHLTTCSSFWIVKP